MAKLSVLIPARNERWLQNTVDDVLQNRRGDTEVIVVLDGQWPVEPLRDHPNVHLIYHSVSVGQREAVNEAARLSKADYVMKLDAHCSVDEGFDLKLIAPYESGELEPNVTTIPRLINLHVFDWVCSACGNHRYQGPTQEVCGQCGARNTQTRELLWKPRWHKVSDFMRFSEDMVFGYWRSYKTRPEAQGDICDVMGGLGACFFLKRDQFWKLGGMDTAHGSWGQMGTEVACKSWLSGGRQVVNKRTHFCHLFRTQGSDFGFPFPISNSDVERARKHSREMWLSNAWSGQVRPLSWIIDKFWPIPGWSDPEGAGALALVRKAAAEFRPALTSASDVGGLVGKVMSPPPCPHTDGTASSLAGNLGGQEMPGVAVGPAAHAVGMMPEVIVPSTDRTGPHQPARGRDHLGGREQVPPDAVGLPSVDGRATAGPDEVLLVMDELHMGWVAAGPIVTDGVVENRDVLPSPARQGVNEPREQQPVPKFVAVVGIVPNAPVASLVSLAGPLPASGLSVDVNPGEDGSNLRGGKMRDGEVSLVSHSTPPLQVSERSGAGRVDARLAPSILAPNPPSACVYYADNRLDPYLQGVCQRQLRRAASNQLIVCVSREPMDFGDIRIVLPGERGNLQMFRQILAGLEALPSDVVNVYLTEQDCLYPPEHFDLTPESHSCYYVNRSNWRVDYETGRALFYLAFAVSGYVAHRELLIEHYRKRVARVIAAGRYERCIGYEPGCHRPPRGIDNYPALSLRSDVPYIDIRHGKNLSKTRWSVSEFRDKKTCLGWTESDRVPGWGITQGRMADFLSDVDRGAMARVA